MSGSCDPTSPICLCGKRLGDFRPAVNRQKRHHLKLFLSLGPHIWPPLDLTTPSGRSLTTVNPAYMTRQVHELGARESGVQGHITSLNPIHPGNAADPWETEALQAFERGSPEVSSIEAFRGEQHMRLMRPLITEEGCLKCHADQGYEVGDIRGGISVSIPMGPLWAIGRPQKIGIVTGHAFLCILGLAGIALAGKKLTDYERVRRATEVSLHLRTRELETANKELESFAYSVSHDLRVPLRGMDGFSKVLLEDYQDHLDEQGKNYLNRIRAGSQQMARLIDDLLNLSRLTRKQMNPESVSLSAMAQEIVTELQEEEPRRQVEFTIAPDIVARGDSQLLHVALQNLLDNAWKFTSQRQQGRIEFGTEEVEGETACYVRDNGAGFDMAYADNLFGAFQRLHKDSEFPGTGIGLATVQRVVHRHGGRVWAEGVVGEGATFYFTLSGPILHNAPVLAGRASPCT